ncbi:citrate/2-methylcitrate synthase [Undibacterium sp. TJN19]|uniref:citrate/2-methylcitrate synthase n=1 Tax=Undibacterium sp. TJN19 TaxID=3413055 RepID=UPI003BF2C81D
MDSITISAREAAQLLGISLPTLYSYVSRGLLHSQLQEGQKAKRYVREDVLRLLARNTDSRRAGGAAESAIDWGVPVLESRITQVTNGQLFYRGHAINDLADRRSLEQVALILWDSHDVDLFDNLVMPELDPVWSQLMANTMHMPAIPRAMTILPALAGMADQATSTAKHTNAAIWMRLTAAVLLATTPGKDAFHQQVATTWKVDESVADILRAAMIVCADHELNVSAFTVRCVASTGAQLGMALCAGLAALSGPKHGGESLRVSAFVRGGLACKPGELQHYLQRRLRTHDARHHFSPRLPGFGHPLYPNGDPRGALLMQLLNTKKHAALLELAATAQAMTGQILNVDFGVVALEIAYGLPQGAAQVLFALGRTAGWIAHALEQVEEGQLIRPRARYVGKYAAPETPP